MSKSGHLILRPLARVRPRLSRRRLPRLTNRRLKEGARMPHLDNSNEHVINAKLLLIDNTLIFYNKALYGIYNNIIYKLFFNLLNVNIKSLNTLIFIIRLLSSKREE